MNDRSLLPKTAVDIGAHGALERCKTCSRFLAPDTVSLPVSELERLQNAERRQLDLEKSLAKIQIKSRSPIFKSPELARFILDNCGTMTQAQIVAACRSKFGDSSPSLSAINRYLSAIKGALEGRLKPTRKPG